MEITITTLSENTAGLPGYLAEWGLSMLIEADSTKILFDTGAGVAAVHNAELMDLDFKDIDRVVISHGHYDHTGGLTHLLKRIRKEIEVIAHPEIFGPKYDCRTGQPEKYIGIPSSRGELENLGARFVFEPFAGPDRGKHSDYRRNTGGDRF